MSKENMSEIFIILADNKAHSEATIVSVYDTTKTCWSHLTKYQRHMIRSFRLSEYEIDECYDFYSNAVAYLSKVPICGRYGKDEFHMIIKNKRFPKSVDDIIDNF